MTLKFIRITILLALAVLGSLPSVAAQRIVNMHIDSVHCIDDSIFLYVELQSDMVSLDIVGNGTMVVHTSDSSFAIAPPAADTTLSYTLRVVFSSGDTIDSLFSVHWVKPYREVVADTLCAGDTAHWRNLVFSSDTLFLIRDTTSYGCDSSIDLSFTFMPSYNLHDTLPFCAGEPFVYEGIDYGGPTTIVIPHQSQYGCDSTVTVHLVTIDSAFHLQLQMSLDGIEWSSDTAFHGCRPLTVYFRDTTLFEQWRLWSFGDGDSLRQEISSFRQPQPITHTYDSVGSYLLALSAESIHGCVDSTVFRKYAVNVYATPRADFTWSPQQLVTHDPQARFANLSEPLDSLAFQWIFPGGDSGADTSLAVSPHYQWPIGTQDVDVVLNAFWTHLVNDSFAVVCTDSSVHTVVILNDYLQFPNVVTPNGDGINDRWEIVNLLLDNDEDDEERPTTLYTMNELWIFDRWGTQVYHVRDISRSEDFWDPKDAPDGTYFFRFSARNQYGLVKRQGTIEVVR